MISSPGYVYTRDGTDRTFLYHDIVYTEFDMLASWGGAITFFLGTSIIACLEAAFLVLCWPFRKLHKHLVADTNLESCRKIKQWFHESRILQTIVFWCLVLLLFFSASYWVTKELLQGQGHVMSTVGRWAQQVAASEGGAAELQDLQRAGRPPMAVTPDMLQRADVVIRADRRIMTRQLILKLLVSKGSVDAIISATRNSITAHLKTELYYNTGKKHLTLDVSTMGFMNRDQRLVISAHSVTDIPTINMDTSSHIARDFRINYVSFMARETIPDSDLIDLEIKDRQCRMPWETLPNSYYPHYSYTGFNRRCTLKELSCLQLHKYILLSPPKKESCPCLQDCYDIQLKPILRAETNSFLDEFSYISVKITILGLAIKYEN
ncbi:hypothetical protein C0J52_00157 [Blattella germanica]|nr:hypothetical protein C0J52_00157 [Blattella germanica]